MKMRTFYIVISAVSLFLFSCHELNAATSKDMPVSVQMLLLSVDALLEANDRPQGIGANENIARIRPLMQKLIDAGAIVNRAELNSLYRELGDHFLDDAVAHARLILLSINRLDYDGMARAATAFLRWQNWWSANRKQVMTIIANRY